MGLAGKRAGRAVAPIPSASWVTEITPTRGVPVNHSASWPACGPGTRRATTPKAQLESAKRKVARTAPLSSASAQP